MKRKLLAVGLVITMLITITAPSQPQVGKTEQMAAVAQSTFRGLV